MFARPPPELPLEFPPRGRMECHSCVVSNLRTARLALNFKMTELLERAFAAACELPGSEQNAFAELLLAELDSEKRWTEAFAASQGQIADLADEALAELAAGLAKPMDLERDFKNN